VRHAATVHLRWNARPPDGRREPADADTAAGLEIDWWRAHRELQHRDRYPDATVARLVDALAALYAYTYDVAVDAVRDAAAHRAAAMDISDRWVADGCDPVSPALGDERDALVAGYTALRAAVGPASGSDSR
jgi:hypothetical protein